MDRRAFILSTAAGLLPLASRSSLAQGATVDLGALAERGQFKLVNRSANLLVDGPRRGVRLSEAAGEGVAFVPGVTLATGMIAIDLRGKDVTQRSFLGVAFHGVDDKTFDSIYFRPFNFRAADPVSRSHSVQYHSLPIYSWDRLRSERPGQYERAATPPPDPNGWFRARIVVAKGKADVFVGDAGAPCLSVNLLNVRPSGAVGLWVGNNSSGDFANLTVTPAT